MELKSNDLDNYLKIFEGTFLRISNSSTEKLVKIIDQIRGNSNREVYWLQGALRGAYYPSYQSIRLKPRLILCPNNQLSIKTDGIIFPNHKPIILVIDFFDKLDYDDQYSFSKILSPEDSRDNGLHPESNVIVSVESENSRLDIKPGFSTWLSFNSQNYV